MLMLHGKVLKQALATREPCSVIVYSAAVINIKKKNMKKQCTVRHQPNELYLVLPVAPERSLLVDMYQVRSAGCVGVLEVNFVQRITLVAVGSPLATPCSMWLDSLATKQSRVPSRSSHVPTSTNSETAQDACRPNTTVRPSVQPKHLLTCKKPCPAWQLVTAG